MRILGTLHAASTSGRTRTYRLLAWGERGRTDVGAVTVDPGVLTLPTDPVPANVQHDPLHPVALTQITPDDAGLLADVTFLDTTAGSDALAEVDAGVRPGISIEVDNPIVRAGRLLGGVVDAVGLVVAPAFPSSRLLAADCGEPTTQITAPAPGEVNAAPAAEEETSAMDDDESTTEAAVETEATDSATLVYGTDQSRLTAALPTSVRPGGKSSKDPRFLAAFAASDEQGRAGLRTRLNAALDQATAADLAPSMVTQWIGEVWNGRTYVRQFIPLLNHGDLTGLKALGWRFKDGKTPQVAPYPGYPAQPNSTAVETESVTLDGTRLAGAGEVDRAWVDFPVPEFWAGYYRECNADYDRKLDVIARDAAIAAATVVVGGAIPAGVAKAAAYIVDGAISIITAERPLPTFALVGSDLYREFLLTRSDDVLAYLSAALQLEEGSLAGFAIRPSAAAALAGKVLVGNKGGATVYELPGASPTRVDTVNVANGGVQSGVFGYHAELINDAKSLALVGPAAG